VATDGKVEKGSDGNLVITFATNSSYFPPGASKRLRRLLAEIDAENCYRVSLQVAVSGSSKVVGAKSPREAVRYNKWLAERRLERVRQWLLENGSSDRLSITPEYLTDDESRQVVVRLTPAGES
jgi:outer membrane protein OmpA-like peptidoglycan-associated protein